MSTTLQGALSDPLVSVIIPAYNAETFIERTLTSVLNQTYRNIEVIVVDDGSHDRTAEIVGAIAQTDKRIRLIQQPNLGVVSARNLAIQQSTGSLIAPLDADDIWFPQNLEKQVNCLIQSDASVGLVYAWSVDINEQEVGTGEFHAFTIEGKVYTTLLCHDFVGNASSTLIRRSCLETVGGYQRGDDYPQGCEDWELYLRIAEHYQFRVVPEFLVGYRKHAQSMSCNYERMAQFRDWVWHLIRQKYPKVPSIIYRLSSSSFYLYLARQCSLNNKHHETLFWLNQAVKVDCVTPFLRLGWYELGIKSLLALVSQTIPPTIRLPLMNWRYSNSKQQNLYSHTGLQPQYSSIRFKVIVGNLLHQTITLLFGTPETWREVSKTGYE